MSEVLDSQWLLQTGFLVVAMSAGFALLEVGSVSVRNTQEILFKNLLSPNIAAVCFWVCGYTFANGSDCDGSRNNFIGTQCYWGMSEVMSDAADLNQTASDNQAASALQIPTFQSKLYASWFFQWAFCATASTIVSGAVAERIKLKLYIIITVVLSAFIYPIVAHWVWTSDGWASATRVNHEGLAERLFEVGVIDFAGGGVVHMVGGMAALVSAYFVGPRHGRFVKHFLVDGHWYARCKDQPLTHHAGITWMEVVSSKSTPSGEEWHPVKFPQDLNDLDARGELDTGEFRWRSNCFPCQSSTFQTFGTLILWYGWYGFNCGSTLGVAGNSVTIASKVAVTTTLSAAGGALSAGLLSSCIDEYNDVGTMSNGMLAGLASITACCAVVEPWAALLIGAIGGALYMGSVWLLERLRIDDVVMAVPVHLACGMWSLLACGIFASPISYNMVYNRMGCGVLYAGAYGCDLAAKQLAAQLVFILAVATWVGGSMFALLVTCKAIFAQIPGADGKKWQPGNSDQPTPLAYDRFTQMYGIDIVRHGGLSGAEINTIHGAQDGGNPNGEGQRPHPPVDTTESVGPASLAMAGQILSSWPPVSRRRTLAQIKMVADGMGNTGRHPAANRCLDHELGMISPMKFEHRP